MSKFRGYVIRLDYAALRATPVATDPFPHIVVKNFVPPTPLRSVLADLPPMGKRGSFPADSLPYSRRWKARNCARRSRRSSNWI
jgi:hypothetical protein